MREVEIRSFGVNAKTIPRKTPNKKYLNQPIDIVRIIAYTDNDNDYHYQILNVLSKEENLPELQELSNRFPNHVSRRTLPRELEKQHKKTSLKDTIAAFKITASIFSDCVRGTENNLDCQRR
jgi:hypothetical protein